MEIIISCMVCLGQLPVTDSLKYKSIGCKEAS